MMKQLEFDFVQEVDVNLLREAVREFFEDSEEIP